ncbi:MULTISPECIES: DNA polymerase III subunit delta' [Silvimonas]|uniref:DNA polymerase III subunit delta' n=1 Tax=Silvimonas TaxID=300264 RepID=UPI0024B3BF08|nr:MULTISPECIES: DNA polymerase III subunit delta' [Silvimonas]MDR3430084.1 DNA polymerase III subunit delta' [Silvimonas sp.]
MTQYELYPWQTAQWQQFMHDPARLPHALLLTGEPGIGKRRFAERLAAWYLCENKDRALAPCGVCEGCRWQAAGNHPDFRILAPADPVDEELEDTKAKRKQPIIGVDEIRELADFVNLSAHRNGARVTLVYPAEAMNTAAANAFLKTLEEPPAGAQFILVAHQARRLLPTIRSRCRVLPLTTPDRASATVWLNEQGVADAELHLAHTGGSPLAALEEADAEWQPLCTSVLNQISAPGSLNVLGLAAEIEKAKVEPAKVIEWLQKWTHDLIALGMSGRIRYYPDREPALTKLAPRAPRMLKYVDRLQQAQRLAHHPLNARLVFESLLFDYLAALRGKLTG